ncbi:MAG: hypothetical protein IPP82_04860 [Xanthomonadales bacterium]|nr:hypothetical protein [Xanthomonadales bacterium]
MAFRSKAAGIQPDIELADLALSENEGDAFGRISERDLRNHLKGDAETPAGKSAGDAKSKPSAPTDYALNEALNALKAMALQQRRAAPPVPTAKENKG